MYIPLLGSVRVASYPGPFELRDNDCCDCWAGNCIEELDCTHARDFFNARLPNHCNIYPTYSNTMVERKKFDYYSNFLGSNYAEGSCTELLLAIQLKEIALPGSVLV